MGRFFEALLKADAIRTNGDHPKPTPSVIEVCSSLEPSIAAPAHSPIAQQMDLETSDEVPFVEVGGPNLEGSASVLASAAPPSISSIQKGKESAKPVQGRQEDRIKISAPGEIAFQLLPASPPPWAPAVERFAPELVALHLPDHSVSQQYRDLLVRVTDVAERSQVFLFSGGTPGSGTTTVVLNLAITCALERTKRVAVVDAHMARPAVAGRLGVTLTPGLAEVLAGTAHLTQALQETGINLFQVLTAGQALKGDATRLAGKPMAQLLHHLRERFDLVLVDIPPTEDAADLPGLSKTCDGVYLVLKQGVGEESEAQDSIDELVQQGIRLRGCVMTHR